MLKVEIDEGCKIQASGDIMTNISDCMTVVREIYRSIYRHDRASAILFREFVKVVVNDDRSPLWKSEGNKPDFEFFTKIPKK